MCGGCQAAASALPERGVPAGEGAAAAARGAEVARSVQLSCGEHTDYGLLTLVNQQPGVAALQARAAPGPAIRVVGTGSVSNHPSSP